MEICSLNVDFYDTLQVGNRVDVESSIKVHIILNLV